MPDPTQTLSVERSAGFLLDSVQEHPKDNCLTVSRFCVEQLRTALSQPEHQGDDVVARSALQQALDFCLGSMGEYGDGSPEFGAYKNAHTFIARLVAKLQPPTPALSDEDKLENAEIWREIHAKRVNALEALLTVCPVCENDFSGGGVDEPSADCSNCNSLGFIVPGSGALSDEERERLVQIADEYEGRSFPGHAAFLRNLASRQ